MRKYFLTSLMLLPLLTAFSYAEQSWSVDPPTTLLGIPSEESGTGAYLGVDVTDVTRERLSTLKLNEEKGVEITLVDQDAPAGKAGIKQHDVILTMNGTSVESGAQLRRMIHETPAGRIVTLGLSRDGQPLSVQVQLGDRRKEFSYVPKVKDFHVDLPPMPNMPDFEMPEINVVVVRSSARSGLMVENLTPQLGLFFGVKDGKGVLIRSVEKGSRADKAGFHAGDVIVKVNSQAVHDTSDFTHALHPSSGSITVGVIRDKKEQNLNLTLPERKDSGESFEEESFKDPVLDEYSYAKLREVQNEIAMLPRTMEIAEAAREGVRAEPESNCPQRRAQAEKLRKDQLKLRNQLRKMQVERSRHQADI